MRELWGWTLSDSSATLPGMHDLAAEEAAARLLHEHLKNEPLTVLFRIRNSRVDYSLMNRPEPTITGVSDAILMTALLHAGRSFTFNRTPASAQRERVARYDGRDVTYRHSIEIDFGAKTIAGTMPHKTVLQVLSIVVQNLAEAASKGAMPPRHVTN